MYYVWSYCPFYCTIVKSAVGDSALPPEDWMGISKACLSPGKYYCGKLVTQSYMGNKQLVMLLVEFQLTRTCYLVGAHLNGCLITSTFLFRLINRWQLHLLEPGGSCLLREISLKKLLKSSKDPKSHSRILLLAF
jgi:hypothetical protein